MCSAKLTRQILPHPESCDIVSWSVDSRHVGSVRLISTMTVGNCNIMPVACVRDLGVQLDQHLNMDQQVTAVCKACNYQLQRLCCIRRYLTTDATKTPFRPSLHYAWINVIHCWRAFPLFNSSAWGGYKIKPPV